jgi:nicotinamidase-related amidase
MNQPIRENLELAEHEGVAWVQCARCGHRLAGAGEDWHRHCIVKCWPPESMGPHRQLLRGRFDLEEHYCPGCGVTLDATIVDVEAKPAPAARPSRRQGGQSIAATPVTLDASTTTLVVLDLHRKAVEPTHVGHSLVHSVPGFLARARKASCHIIFVVPAQDKGSPEDRPAEAMERRCDEPVLYSDAYDKFAEGELQTLLQSWNTRTLIFLGGSANFSLLYTATTAARIHGYSVVVPIDGIYAHSDYEMDYALYQLTVLPGIQDKFRFTSLAGIDLNKPSRPRQT